MRTRDFQWWFPVLCAALSLGCQGNAPTSPTPQTPAALPATLADHLPLGDSLIGLYDIRIDPSDWTASITPHATRQGASPQAISYDLDIEEFMQADTLKLAGIRLAGEAVAVELLHAHPFPAPNFANPITGLNRADLGYTGRLLVLSATSTETFYSGGAVCDPTLLGNMDGMVRVGDLLRTAVAGPHNTFPYKLLVDDGIWTREGFPVGPPQGNYQPGNHGWQRTNIGGPDGNNGWTGYDYLHGGQTSRISLEVNLAALEANDFTFTTAILIKYTDPRGDAPAGGELRDRRFPPLYADPLAFAYRLPFAALDNSVVELIDPVVIGTAAGAQATVRLRVRDWDATATEHPSDVRLDDQTNVSLIQRDAGGWLNPSLSATQLANSVPSFAHVSGTGLPGDELIFETTLTNVLGTAPSGRLWAMARVIDPEDGDPSANLYRFGADPVTLVPEASRALAVRTYLPIPVEVHGTSWAQTMGLTHQGGPNYLRVDNDGNIYWSGYYEGTVTFDAPGGPTLHSQAGSIDTMIVKHAPDGELLWVRSIGGTEYDNVSRMEFLPGGDLILAGRSQSPTLDLDPTIGTDIQSNGGAPALDNLVLIRLTADGEYVWGHYWGSDDSTEFLSGLAVTPSSLVLSGYLTFGTSDLDPGPAEQLHTPTNNDSFVLLLNHNGGFMGVNYLESLQSVWIDALSVDGSGNIYMGGTYDGTDMDFDPGAGSSPAVPPVGGFLDVFMASWSPLLNYRWSGVLTGDDTETLTRVHVSGPNVIGMGQSLSTSIDLDPGPGTDIHANLGAGDIFLTTLLRNTGAFVRGSYFGGSSIDFPVTMLNQSDGTVNLLWLTLSPTVDVDPGSGEEIRVMAGAVDIGLTQFDPAGNWLRTQIYGGAGADYALALGQTPYGTLLMGGFFRDTTDLDPGPGVASFSPTGPFGSGYLVQLNDRGEWQ